MNSLDEVYTKLTLPTSAKLVLLVLDGLGDLAVEDEGYLTPLEAASTPNLDDLTQNSAQGRLQGVAPGITPGCGAGHLGLFGYNPLEYPLGRGVMEAFRLKVGLQPGDVAARANFCTLNSEGVVTDRRAGRLNTTDCVRLCEQLSQTIPEIEDVKVTIQAGRGHRLVVVFRGPGLGGPVADFDPGEEGHPIPRGQPVDTTSHEAQKTARIVQALCDQARETLREEGRANGLLLRGIATQPVLTPFSERFQLHPVSLAIDSTATGLAQLVGMTCETGMQSLEDQFRRYRGLYDRYDYFFIHYKYPENFGIKGQFEAKKKAIEDLDAALPQLMQKRPDVLAITGDHSTPCSMSGASWHPQPVLLNSPFSGSDKLDRFNETAANLGSLGVFESRYLIRLMQAHARMFKKYGA